MGKLSYYTAFGETKSLKEWAEDVRCKVSYGTLCKRLTDHNWEIELALTEEKHNYGPAKLEGKRFGRLTVRERVKNSRKKSTSWLCVCDCGKEKIIPISALISGHTKSCGCYREEYRKERCGKNNTIGYGLAARNGIVLSYKQGAKIRNIEWDLSDGDVFNLIKQNCHYCGKEPSQVRKGLVGDYIYNGIDRLDSSLGYAKQNVTTCCKECNYGKRNMSHDDFVSHIKRTYLNLQQKRIIT